MKNAELWKRILNEGLDQDYNIESQPHDLANLELAIMTHPIIQSPIIGDPSKGFRGWDCFGQLSIPFPKFWMEGKTETGEKDAGGNGIELTWGVLVTMSDDMRIAIFHIFVSSKFRQPAMAGYCHFPLNESMEIETNDGALRFRGRISNLFDREMKDDGLPREERISFLTAICYYACDTLVLLGCKNVSLQPRENDPKQVRRAVKRHGGTPEKYRYHVLVVRPAGSKPGTPGQEIGVMPRHVCRGHFSEYGPEFGKGLLFGKYAGRFFIPPHMKGDKNNGVVEKDYAIAPQA